MQFSSIQPIDRALSGATIPDQSGPGSNGNEGVRRIPQSPSITGTSLLCCLVSYPGHSTEVQLGYSTAPANWAMSAWIKLFFYTCFKEDTLFKNEVEFTKRNEQ